MKPETRCWLNILALMKYYRLPILQPVKKQRDRCYFKYDMKFSLALLDLYLEGKFCSFAGGYREAVPMYSAEIIQSRDLIEIDFDFFNPSQGAGIVLLHGIECAWNWMRKRKTDPFKIAKGLVKRGLPA